MKTHSNEIRIYYNPILSKDKQVLAMARTISSHVHEVEINKTPCTPTMWKRLLGMLALRPKDLLNRSDPYYQSNIRGKDYDVEGWLNILVHNPQLLKAPIVVRGNQAILCQRPYDVLKLK